MRSTRAAPEHRSASAPLRAVTSHARALEREADHLADMGFVVGDEDAVRHGSSAEMESFLASTAADRQIAGCTIEIVPRAAGRESSSAASHVAFRNRWPARRA